MKEYIEREEAVHALAKIINNSDMPEEWNKGMSGAMSALYRVTAANVRPVVTCAECKHNNVCLTQAFVEEASRVPFDRNTFFCADGKRADDA